MLCVPVDSNVNGISFKSPEIICFCIQFISDFFVLIFLIYNIHFFILELIYCADCGARLTYNSGNKPKPKSYYFMCSSYRRHKDGDCILPHRIREIVLDEIVREEINQAIYYAVNEKDKFVECISKRSLSESRKKLSQKITELDRLNNRKNELNVIFRKLYEDNALGKIPDD